MERLEKQIELIKDAFIIYCAKRFENDPAIQDMINDILYFESKRQAVISSKRRREDKENFNSKIHLEKLKKFNENLPVSIARKRFKDSWSFLKIFSKLKK